MSQEALKDLLFRMADDALIYGHRNAEWTGLAPTLEEDISFSSIAQDKFGHAQALYTILHGMGEADPDSLGFMRSASELRCCQFVEFETMDYALGLVRHAFFDLAERNRYHMLETSSHTALSELARKIRGEIKYHVFHAQIWLKLLGVDGSDDSRVRMQQAIDYCYPRAYSMFEHGVDEQSLIDSGVFAGEEALKQKWEAEVAELLNTTGFAIPIVADKHAYDGGRKGKHTAELEALVSEMTEVYRIDPSASW